MPRQTRVTASTRSAQSSLSSQSQTNVLRPGRLGRRGRPGRLFLAVLSGVLFALSFPPADFGWLAWVALVPLLLAIDGLQPPEAFRLGYLGGFIAWLLVVSWIRVYGVPVWLLLSGYLALQFGAFAGAYRWIVHDRPAWAEIAAVPLLWTALEFLRSIGPFGFPWALLGLTQHAYLPVIQAARVTAVFGVSFVVAMGTAFVYGLLRRRLVPAAAVLIFVALAVGWGSREAQRMPAASLRVAALQPNIDPKAKFDPRYAREIMSGLEGLVHEAAGHDPQLVVFPETAVPFDLFGPGGALGDVGRWANAARATLIASSLENGRSNTAVTVAPSGEAVDRYDKVRLVAFGEVGIVPGTQHKPLWSPAGRVGVAICFESIFPQAGRALTRNGAELLAIITNDGVIAPSSGLDRWAGPEQHAAHAVLRAVENGRWVVRAANTGLTTLIDPYGRIRGEIARGRPGVLVGEAALTHHPTIFTSRGDVFAVGILIASLFLAIPRIVPSLMTLRRRPPFRLAAAAAALPFIAVWSLLQTHVPEWVWIAVLIAFMGIFSTMQRPRAWGFSGLKAIGSAALGLSAVLLLWLLITSAYRAQQIPVFLVAPASGWLRHALAQVIIAAAIESWLRGYAFSALSDSIGTAWTIALTTLIGVMLQTGLPPESYAWAMVTGAAFGLIRARTGNTLGPIAGHALGNVLMSAIAIIR